MPIYPFPINQPDTFCQWLQNELNDNLSIVPHIDSIPDNLQRIKGIYFWFMKPTGYADLSKFVSISLITPVCTRTINGEVFHLVYLGTAGMGKNGGSDLLERLKWHIKDKHTKSAVCSGALSTLRQGLGALLSDDLISPNTEQLVNDFIKSYMRVYWIPYQGQENLINDNENALIKNLRPLLNIRNNPNARTNAPLNSTRIYKLRRMAVIDATRKRLNCGGESQAKRSKKTPSDDIIFTYKEQILSDNENCVEFSVYQHQSIAEIIRGIPGLSTGKVNFKMYDAANPLHHVFPGWEKTGSGKQNIYTYFANTGGVSYRYQLIQQYMRSNGIEELVVKVCWEDESRDNTKKTIIIPNQEKITLSKNFKVVMICASRKNGVNLSYGGSAIAFQAVSNPAINQFLPDDTIPIQNITWRTFVSLNQNGITLPFQAYQLYWKQIYRDLFGSFGPNLYILSAAWGLVRADFRLPKYDITFSDEGAIETQRMYNIPVYADFNQLVVEDNDDIVFIGTPPYLQLFFACTAHLPNRKIIYYKKADLPNRVLLPNGTFVYRRYITNTSRNWHYELAQDLINGIIS